MQTYFLIALSTLLPIVNPLGALGPFLAMTAGEADEKRAQIAMRAAKVCLLVLLGCAILGMAIFQFFGISLPALQIAGGVLLFNVAFDMLNARQSRSKSTDEEAIEGVEKHDIAIFPLAIPLLSGPGAIVSVFMLVEKAGQSLKEHIYLYLAVLITVVISWLVLRQASRIARFLGQIGINVFSRLMGLILAGVAVQFVLDGIYAAFPSWVQ